MRIYIFKSETRKELRAFAADLAGSKLPQNHGPWTATGAIGTFRKGAAILAMDAGVPIVPVYVDGMYEVLPRFRRVPRPGRVTVTFSPPIKPDPDDDYDSFIARAEMAVRHLAGPKGEAVEPPGASRSEGPTYWY